MEYGIDIVVGLYVVCDVLWSEEYQIWFLEMFYCVFDCIDNVVGEYVWNFVDFQIIFMIIRVDGNKKGVFMRD